MDDLALRIGVTEW